jgi:predicted  nucleic acid-binding Zn-ribbon protein
LKEISALQQQTAHSLTHAEKQHAEEERSLLAELHALESELSGIDQQIEQAVD